MVFIVQGDIKTLKGANKIIKYLCILIPVFLLSLQNEELKTELKKLNKNYDDLKVGSEELRQENEDFKTELENANTNYNQMKVGSEKLRQENEDLKHT